MSQTLLNVPNHLNELMAAAFALEDQPDQATAYYEQILQQYPHHATAYYRLGLLLFSQSHPEAVRRLEQAIKLSATEEQYWVSYVDALMLTGQLQKASAAIQLGQQYGLSQPFAIELARECVERMTQERSSSIEASTSTMPPQGSLDQLWQQACLLQNENQYQEAIGVLAHIVEIAPDHGEAQHALGRLLAETQSLEDALPHLEAALSSAPEIEQHWVTYIDAMLQLNAFKTAFDAMQAVRQYGLSESMQAVLFSDTINMILQMLDSETADQDLLWTALINDSGLYNQIVQDNLTAMEQIRQSGKLVDGCMQLDACMSFLHQFPILLEPQRLMRFIRMMVVKLMWVPELIGHKIFAPDFDQLLSQITLQMTAVVPRHEKRANFVIATEVYDFGGHTKDVLAILNTIENPVLVITDLYGRFSNQAAFKKIASALPPTCPVIVLPNEPYLQKSTRLAALVNQQARNVFLLTHHDDVVAAVACQATLDTHYYFIHHADHNLAIGNAIPHLKHIDLFGGRAIHCHEDLGLETQCLPTTSHDLGAKVFATDIQQFATVTAGSFGKFKNDGPLALATIVAESLHTTGGKHYHFGEMPQQALEGVRQTLSQQGLDPDNFVYMGNVPSLWKALQDIDGHIFVGSAPIMGAKSDIEAQGAGYPLLAYRAVDCPRHMNVGSHAPETHYWHDMVSFKAALQDIMANHAGLSASARAYYEAACSMQTYQQMLMDMSH